MDAFANELIDQMGGTTAVSQRVRTSTSTVHSWRVKGLSPSRLDHLRRIVQSELPSVDVEAIAATHGVSLPSMERSPSASRGNAEDVSAAVAA